MKKGLIELSSEEKRRLKELEKAFGHTFRNKDLLRRALTHRSYANEKRLPQEEHNERLEFLGDAVLELSISEFLMKRFQDYSEGKLSKLRAAIVNEGQLAEIAKALKLGDYLYLGHGEEQSQGRTKNSLLADAFEALLGATYLDKGYKKAAQIVERHYEKLLSSSPLEEFYRDYKTDLQEKAQALFRAIPRYKLAGEEGPDHEKIFKVELFIREHLMGKGIGRSKKEAEQHAAQEALDKL